MMIRRFLVAIAMTTVATLAGACAAGADDDDDDDAATTLLITGGNTVAVGATLQLTATTNPGGTNVTNTATWSTNSAGIATVTGGLVTPVNVGQATITATLGSASDVHIISVTGGVAAQEVEEDTSFLADGGNELWVCLISQFDGELVNMYTQEGASCVGYKENLALTANAEAPTFHAVTYTGMAGCTAGGVHQYFLDYKHNETDCEGCVDTEYDFTLPANSTFGDLCGQDVPIAELFAYRSKTTMKDRFSMTIDSLGPVSLTELIVYGDATANPVGGPALLTKCTATVTIAANSTGIFDADCDAAVLTSSAAGVYSAIVKGSLGSSKFQGRYDFDYVPAP